MSSNGVGLVDVISSFAGPSNNPAVNRTRKALKEDGSMVNIQNSANLLGPEIPGSMTDLQAQAIQNLNPEQLKRLLGGQGVTQGAPAQGSSPGSDEQSQLMQLMLGALMDPGIDANDVGSQLMQRITMDALQGGAGATPQSLLQGLGGILTNLMGANAQGAKK